VYTIRDLGSFGGDTTRAFGINKNGDVIGSSKLSANAGGYSKVFLFTDANGLVDLGIAGSSYGAAINDSDQIAFDQDRYLGKGDYTAHRYTPGVGVVDLGALPTDTWSYATAINASGQVAGGSLASGSDGQRGNAFRYSDGSEMQDLGNLCGARAQANGINSQGWVVGWAATPDTPPGEMWNPGSAFLYAGGLGLIDLNAFVDTRKWHVRCANAINDLGQIVGYGLHEGVVHAFRLKGKIIEDLGTFPNGGTSYAAALNSNGCVVGTAYLDTSGADNFRAAVWLPGTLGAQDLNNLIPQTAGWVLRQATAINESGQIVGWGYVNNQTRAFRLSPA
jgi:probable HAF family extracellular repeat protein